MKIHFWHTNLSLFFAALAIVAYHYLAVHALLPSFIPLADFLLIALATMRLVRLFTYDAITSFIREWFYGAKEKSLMEAFGTLINCPWCMGLWFSLVVLFFYFLSPISWYAILVLALASVASMLQLLANLIGWSAEAKKREAQGPQGTILPR